MSSPRTPSGTRSRSQTRTQVAVVGAGPAGLMLSHLLARAGIDSVAIDLRTRREIEETHRAGILEQDSVDLLVDTGVSDRVHRDGYRHDGIELAFGGASHRIDFRGLVGASTQLYPQTDVFVDLADARARDGGDVRFGVRDVAVDGLATTPAVRFTDADGADHEVRADFLVGADGSRSLCRRQVPEAARRQYFREYPFAWFGILAEAPPSAPELIYNHSARGFALISQRTESLQRMYFQCDPDEVADAWSDDRIWDELQGRLSANGHVLKEGPIISRTVLPFRSFVQEPMHHGRLVLAGDAAHTVPPTGAKGLNLALADVRVLAEELERAVDADDPARLATYSERALGRVWKAQHFSYWMTTMLHTLPDASPFDVRRQEGELSGLVASTAGSTYLAEAYTGWPGGR
ncbi:4-hydroxybenzoate 3-monooxygenase [Nocardioides guangzhouensis]|uniref:4-hydroxybenzoate 3-monooxygenase n=1 Tax=Nocardioides guangzhouensis TaxID=2497878 RepID=A0A4Q4ZHL1_9ACTN|nr:4-hydroxybenzoate 3-monooxygenase [Nocardioides guangzhouensis]RYP87737.1 4-hydroxybenzoate 3-monooxygenase [Nocardioides guangzhouensis]